MSERLLYLLSTERTPRARVTGRLPGRRGPHAGGASRGGRATRSWPRDGDDTFVEHAEDELSRPASWPGRRSGSPRCR